MRLRVAIWVVSTSSDRRTARLDATPAPQPSHAASAFVLTCLGFVTLMLAVLPTLAAASEVEIPVAPKFQVNTYTVNAQTSPSIAAALDDSFILVWHSWEQDGWEYGVFAQRYGSDGTPLGAEFQVNTYTSRAQSGIDLTIDGDGRSIVVWTSAFQDGSLDGSFAQRYDSAGNPIGVEFQVNTYTVGFQSGPDVAADAVGNFTVVWSSESTFPAGQDGDIGGVFAQRYDSGGNRVGGEFLVNSYTLGGQSSGDIAAAPDGRSIVVWSSNHQDGSLLGIFGQRFNSSGSATGSEFQVNTQTFHNQVSPVACMFEAMTWGRRSEWDDSRRRGAPLVKLVPLAPTSPFSFLFLLSGQFGPSPIALPTATVVKACRLRRRSSRAFRCAQRELDRAGRR